MKPFSNKYSFFHRFGSVSKFKIFLNSASAKTLNSGGISHFYEIMSFDMQSTAILPPLTILEYSIFFSMNPIYFLKKKTVFVRSEKSSVAFYGKFDVIKHGVK